MSFGHIHGNYAVINCIPGPHHPCNSWVLAGTYNYPGIYRILCHRRPGTYPGLYAGRYFFQKGQKSLTKGAGNGAWGYGAGTYIVPMDLQEKCPPQSRAVTPGQLRTQGRTSQSTKLNPGASPHYPWVVCVCVGGGGVTN